MLYRLATLKHALPLVESLNEGLTDLTDWITQGEQLVEDGRMGRSADIQKYAEQLQVSIIGSDHVFQMEIRFQFYLTLWVLHEGERKLYAKVYCVG